MNFFWGRIKSLADETPVSSVEDLFARISVASERRICDIPEIFQNARNSMQPRSVIELACLRKPKVVGSTPVGPVVKVSDHDKHVMSSSPVPLKTRRIGERCTLNMSRAQTSSHRGGVVVRRGGTSSGVVPVT
ncbi:hypothetical protein TNCV_1285071 [Trichonephila clavipes]|uniref:Uncharacterized protein n=1 Tax=Trichonephila clavipes TaxID=2585209 RepID=A0A8X6VET5_TRICX|nr:hypothetical protein TNCV_1285071 [Trichonephila clavipes]